MFEDERNKIVTEWNSVPLYSTEKLKLCFRAFPQTKFMGDCVGMYNSKRLFEAASCLLIQQQRTDCIVRILSTSWLDSHKS
jgi:hypothetical protein